VFCLPDAFPTKQNPLVYAEFITGNTGDSRYVRGVPVNLRVSRKRKWLKHNNRHFDVKLAPEFFHAKLIICMTFPDKPGDGLTQVIRFKI
jgi:hypothetical protein